MLARRGRNETASARDVARNALSGLAVTLTGMAVMDYDGTVGLIIFGAGVLWMVTTVNDIDEEGAR